MKKFLSLVLALVMAMSLVTISAGATEYKDLTDKDEIQYEEAVAVLNRIGIITGYDDGSFQPKKELTRGAAAKIIVSLLIGPEAAGNLPNNSSPYPDVPANHTFAGVISFCKTEEIISGYGDGTFRPGDSLTGYAFAKMLLGALGYSSNIEGFTGSGWTNNVARIANVAGLLDRLQFNGSAAVNREQACQLALNTLKATMVTYGGSTIINGSTGSFTMQGTTATMVTSNNKDINRNIGKNESDQGGRDYYTLEFGEEHFKDLRLEHDRFDPAIDDFGRPSNEWSYKKVTIGTFPLEADYTYTEQVAHLADKDAAKVRALKLNGFEVSSNESTHGIASGYNKTQVFVNGRQVNDLDKLATIADYTDNGATVYVYVDELDADFISYVSVIQPMLVKVKNVGSDYVSFELIEADDKGNGFNQYALDNYNDGAQRGMNEIDKLEDLQAEDDYYDVVKDLKAGDYVVTIPVNADHENDAWEVSKAYVPETVTGKLSKVETYDGDVTDIVVGGTSYKVSQWNKDMKDIDADIIKVTVKDVTLYLDEGGNALLADEVGEVSGYMVIGSWSKSLVNGKLVDIAEGWDVNGDPLSLNVGSSKTVSKYYGDTINGKSYANEFLPGDLVKYTNDGAPAGADWVLLCNDDDTPIAANDVYKNLVKIYEVSEFGLSTDFTVGANYIDVDGSGTFTTGDKANYQIKSSNIRLALRGDNVTFTPDGAGGLTVGGTDRISKVPTVKNADKDLVVQAGDIVTDNSFYFAKNPMFIYVDFDNSGDVENIQFVKGIKNVTTDELMQQSGGNGTAGANHPAQAYLDKNGEVKAVVIKTQSNEAKTNNLLYVREHWASHEYTTETGKVIGLTVAMLGEDGLVRSTNIYTDKDLKDNTFATFTKAEKEGYEPFYKVNSYDTQTKTTSVASATVNASGDGSNVINKWLVKLGNPTKIDGTGLADPTGHNPLVDGDSWIMSNQRGTSDMLPSDSNNAKQVANFTKANWINLTDNTDIDDVEDLKDYVDVRLHLVFNDNKDSDGFRNVDLAIVVNGVKADQRAAVPTVSGLTVTSPKASYSKGEIIELNAAVADGKYGTLSYKWEYSNNGGSTWTVFGTDASKVNFTKGSGSEQVRVTVTNTDNKYNSPYNKATASKDITLNEDVTTATTEVTVTVTGGTFVHNGNTVKTAKLTVPYNGLLLPITAGTGKQLPATATLTKADGTTDTVTIEDGMLVINGGMAGTIAVVCDDAVKTTKTVTFNLTNCYVTVDGQTKTNGDTLEVEAGASLNLTIGLIDDNSDTKADPVTADGGVSVLSSTATTALVKVADDGTVTIDRSKNTHTVEVKSNAVTGYASADGATLTKTAAKGEKLTVKFVSSTLGSAATAINSLGTITPAAANGNTIALVANSAKAGVDATKTDVTIADADAMTAWLTNEANNGKTLYYGTFAATAGDATSFTTITADTVFASLSGGAFFTDFVAAKPAEFEVEITIGTADWTITGIATT